MSIFAELVAPLFRRLEPVYRSLVRFGFPRAFVDVVSGAARSSEPVSEEVLRAIERTYVARFSVPHQVLWGEIGKHLGSLPSVRRLLPDPHEWRGIIASQLRGRVDPESIYSATQDYLTDILYAAAADASASPEAARAAREMLGVVGRALGLSGPQLSRFYSLYRYVPKTTQADPAARALAASLGTLPVEDALASAAQRLRDSVVPWKDAVAGAFMSSIEARIAHAASQLSPGLRDTVLDFGRRIRSAEDLERRLKEAFRRLVTDAYERTVKARGLPYTFEQAFRAIAEAAEAGVAPPADLVEFNKTWREIADEVYRMAAPALRERLRPYRANYFSRAVDVRLIRDMIRRAGGTLPQDLLEDLERDRVARVAELLEIARSRGPKAVWEEVSQSLGTTTANAFRRESVYDLLRDYARKLFPEDSALHELFDRDPSEAVRRFMGALKERFPNDYAQVRDVLRSGLPTQRVLEKIANLERDVLVQELLRVARAPSQAETLFLLGDQPLIFMGPRPTSAAYLRRIAGTLYTSPFLRKPRYGVWKRFLMPWEKSLELYIERWSKDAAYSTLLGPNRELVESFIRDVLPRIESEAPEVADVILHNLEAWFRTLRAEYDPALQRLVRLVRIPAVAGYMGFSYVANFWQIMNDAAFHGFRGLAAYVKALAGGDLEKARRLAALAGSLSQYLGTPELTGIEGRARKFLEWTLFNVEEGFLLRPLAALGARETIVPLVRRAVQSEEGQRELIKYLRRIGFGRGLMEDPVKVASELMEAMKAGRISESLDAFLKTSPKEALEAAFTDPFLKTVQAAINASMFNYVPSEFPAWAGTPFGSLSMMFRRFGYLMVRNVLSTALSAAKEGDFRPLITLAAYSYPAGRFVSYARAFLTGRPDPEEDPFRKPYRVAGIDLRPLQGYLEAVFRVGAGGLAADVLRLILDRDLPYMAAISAVFGVVPADAALGMLELWKALQDVINPTPEQAQDADAIERFLRTARPVVRRASLVGAGLLAPRFALVAQPAVERLMSPPRVGDRFAEILEFLGLGPLWERLRETVTERVVSGRSMYLALRKQAIEAALKNDWDTFELAQQALAERGWPQVTPTDIARARRRMEAIQEGLPRRPPLPGERGWIPRR
jgi:hypothetical protein